MPLEILMFCLATFLLLCRFFAFVTSFLLVPYFRSFLQARSRCSALRLVCGAFGEYENLVQEMVPGVIEHRSKCCLNGHLVHNS